MKEHLPNLSSKDFIKWKPRKTRAEFEDCQYQGEHDVNNISKDKLCVSWPKFNSSLHCFITFQTHIEMNESVPYLIHTIDVRMPLILNKKVLEYRGNEKFFCEWHGKVIAELGSKFNSSICWILYSAEWSPYDFFCAATILQSLHMFSILLY